VSARLFLFYQPTARKREQLPELSAYTERHLFGRPHVGRPSPDFASTEARPDSFSRTYTPTRLNPRLGLLKRRHAAVCSYSERLGNEGWTKERHRGSANEAAPALPRTGAASRIVIMLSDLSIRPGKAITGCPVGLARRRGSRFRSSLSPLAFWLIQSPSQIAAASRSHRSALRICTTVPTTLAGRADSAALHY